MAEMYVRLSGWLEERKEQEQGQGLAEYALILVLVSIAAFVALGVLGTNVSTALSEVASQLG